MPPVGLEPTMSVGERPQIYALGGAATWDRLLVPVDIPSTRCSSVAVMVFRSHKTHLPHDAAGVSGRHLLTGRSRQWRTQEFFSVGGFNKFS